MTFEVVENVWIDLDDGRTLAARLWLPQVRPAPAILEYLPYRKRDGTAPRDETTHPVFAEAGYACVRVDIAGTGDSTGRFDDEYSEQELRDGEAVLRWISKQDWCDGAIGMIGISWGGFNGLQLAFRQPPSLKAVVSVASTVDRYADDIHFMGGCLLSDNVNWGSQMFAYLTRPPDPELRSDWREAWLERLEHVPFSAADWLCHQHRDAYWRHGSICEDWQAIRAPVLAITGWADAYVNAPPAIAAHLSVPSKAVIGPWEHRYAHLSKLDPADFHSEVINWFDRWLKGVKNGAEHLPDYRTYMQEHFNPTATNGPRRGRWISEAEWPSPNVSEHVWHLTRDGFSAEAQNGSVTVASPAHLGATGGYFCPGMRVDNELAGDQAEDDALSACFDGVPLESPLELLGRAKFKFQFSVDRPVAQLIARLCDVSPDGVSQRISYRALNLCHHRSHAAPEALQPGKTYEAEIVLNECAHRLRQGHRLRLAISTAYWPIIWPAPQNAKVTLHLHGCSLHLPVRQVSIEDPVCAPKAARDFPTLASESLRLPKSVSQRTTAEDGGVVLTTFDDYGKTRDPYHQLVVGSDVRMRYSIHPEDAATARFDATWHFTFERDDWQVAIETKCSMSCSDRTFFLSRALRATEGPNGHVVLSKTLDAAISRELV